MEKMTRRSAFDRITDEIGFRAVAVALYRIMTSKNPVLVVKNEKRVEWFNALITGIREEVTLLMLGKESKESRQITIISEKEYKKNWKDFAGKEICMVEEETTVKNPGVDLLMQTLVKQHAKDFLNEKIPEDSSHFLEEIDHILRRIVTAVTRIREAVKQSKRKKIGKRKLKRILNKTVDTEHESRLVFHIYELMKNVELPNSCPLGVRYPD